MLSAVSSIVSVVGVVAAAWVGHSKGRFNGCGCVACVKCNACTCVCKGTECTKTCRINLVKLTDSPMVRVTIRASNGAYLRDPYSGPLNAALSTGAAALVDGAAAKAVLDSSPAADSEEADVRTTYFWYLRANKLFTASKLSIVNAYTSRAIVHAPSANPSAPYAVYLAGRKNLVQIQVCDWGIDATNPSEGYIVIHSRDGKAAVPDATSGNLIYSLTDLTTEGVKPAMLHLGDYVE